MKRPPPTGLQAISPQSLTFGDGQEPGLLAPPLARVGPSATTTATVLLALIDELIQPLLERSGRSPLRATPPLPTAVGRLVTRYGPRRGYDPAQGFHTGLDFYAPRGTSVFAVNAGRVEWVACDDSPQEGFVGYGNAVVLYHEEEDLWTFYAHLDEVLVLEGMEVESGQAIGLVGNTTNDRLPGMFVRLHFELRRRGLTGESPFPGPYRVNTIDPEPWLRRHGVFCDDSGQIIEETPPRADDLVSPLIIIEPSEGDLEKAFARPTPRPEMIWDDE